MATSLPSAQDCEPVKWHSRQKHEFIRQYLEVWTARVARRGMSGPKLGIVDLFAGRGWCCANPTTDPGAPKEPWPGSAVLAAKALSAYPRPGTLVLNCFDPSQGAAASGQMASLQRAIASELGPSPRFPVKYLALDSVAAAGAAARLVDLDYPTVWILDPYASDALPWTVVGSIAALQRTYNAKRGKGSRRPELIITLMTEGLQRNIDINPGMTDLALGIPETAWRPMVQAQQAGGANVRQALIYIYAERLKAIYGKNPTVIEVDSSQGNIVYAVFLVSSHDAGTFVPKILLRPEFRDWKISSWKPTALRIAKNRTIRRFSGPKAPIQKSLESEFGPQTPPDQNSDATGN
jgi:three-Cys-motif partner protein